MILLLCDLYDKDYSPFFVFTYMILTIVYYVYLYDNDYRFIC